MHVVQIWIMHKNALKTQLMHKNVQTNPEKSQKFTQHSCCSMLTREKIESNKGQWIFFCSQRWDVPYREPSCLLWEAPVREKYIPQPAQMGQICTTTCWCRSMIACQVSWISDEFWIYKNLKTRHLNVLPAINGALVFEIHSHFLHGT